MLSYKDQIGSLLKDVSIQNRLRNPFKDFQHYIFRVIELNFHEIIRDRRSSYLEVFCSVGQFVLGLLNSIVL